MAMIRGLLLLLLCGLLPSSDADSGFVTKSTKRIIVDTDIFSDVDDVGSLAIANVLHNYGYADLLGVAVNTRSKYGALAVSAINTYYGNGDVPIAALRPLTDEMFHDTWYFVKGEYVSKVAHNWRRFLNDSSTTPSPTKLYRSILASAEDHSITIISLGFLTNIAALMDSPPDDESPLQGTELISSKLRELVVMGGQYPSGLEFNFGGDDPGSTYQVVNDWPHDVPITFSGFELGKDIFSGQGLADDAPADSPVLAAYQWYVGRCSTTHNSWDPIATLYGILGLNGILELKIPPLFEYANEYGYNKVSADGSNVWVNDSSITNQHWLRLANGVTNTTVSRLLNRFLSHQPPSNRCEICKLQKE